MSEYIGTTINQSATIVLKANAALTGAQGIAIGVTSGKAKIPSAGDPAIGIALFSNDAAIAQGDDVQIQIKDIAKWIAAEAIAVGDLVATDANGKAVKAGDGEFIMGVAMNAAANSGDVISVQLTKSGYKVTGLGSLPDVDLSTEPTDGQVLKYVALDEAWKPGADATT